MFLLNKIHIYGHKSIPFNMREDKVTSLFDFDISRDGNSFLSGLYVAIQSLVNYG